MPKRAVTLRAPPCLHVPAVLAELTASELWVVSTLVYRRFALHKPDPDGWHPLSSVYLRDHLSLGYRAVVDGLVRRGILEENPYYHFGPGERGTCRTYRLAGRYRDLPMVPVPLTDRPLLKRIAHHDRNERLEVTDPTHIRLRDWHDRVRVDGAERGTHPLVDRMLDGERRFSVCDYGRVHTNVTNIPRMYRHHLHWDGVARLVVVDVGSSQPLLVALLLVNTPRETLCGQVDIPLRGTGTPHPHYDTPTTAHPPVPTPLRHPAVPPYPYLQKSGHLMREDAMTGRFYDRVSDATAPTLPREVVKREVIALLYGQSKTKTPETVAVAAAFRRAYPGVLEWCGDWPHGELPRLMQRVEASVMIDGAAGAWLRDHPDVPVATIHDAFVVPADHADKAANVIRAAWSHRLGVEPTIRTTTL